VICYNCSQPGHIFGTLENLMCTAEVTPKTLKYFKKRKTEGGKFASGSGESKA
ncbi:hypothetical protein CROQUDRAFT_46029, partial [Cronartium quercuum f. sp. fusiforme G11]